MKMMIAKWQETYGALMNNPWRLGLAVLMICSLALTSATTALAAEKDVQLLGARFIVGKGLLVTLKIFDNADLGLAASVTIDGVQYDLDCRVAEESSFYILRCLATVATDLVGHEATIYYGAEVFTLTLKEPRPWCYTVFDFGAAGWGPIGTQCQVRIAGIGDMIRFHNPEYPAVPFWNYRYDLDSHKACNGHSSDFGDGYYFYC